MCKAAHGRRRGSRAAAARSGFSLPELALVILILFLLGLFLFPVFTRAKVNGNRRRNNPASPQKQIALSFMQYIQDYDEHFPPASGVVAYDSEGKAVRQSWGPDRPLGNGRVLPGLLQPYVKSRDMFRASYEGHIFGFRRTVYLKNTPGYLYNDLLVGREQSELTGVANTVLTTDGEDQTGNVGHAWVPDAGPFDTTFTDKGTVAPGGGATVRTAPRRRSNGANYSFTDGHVKWFKAGAIYFPPRESDSRAHVTPDGKEIGPDPAGGIQVNGSGVLTFERRTFAGTFHIR
ncbi:MAG TPA: hypothetical protein VM490_04280 [Armatimonadaceae bacterium]|nr:hypothetical protein [Armatimonadaceae bacterium]